VEKLEGIIDVNTFKGGISMVQDYILVPKKDLATAIRDYLIGGGIDAKSNIKANGRKGFKGTP